MRELVLLGRLHSFKDLPALSAFTCHTAGNVEELVHKSSELQRCEVLVMGGAVTVPTEALDKLPALQLIAVQGVGYDGVPVTYCQERGIAVTHTPDVLTDDVADLALALVLMTQRRLGEGERFVRAGSWENGAFPLGRTLARRTAGIVGLGRIGKAVAQRLEACGMRIAYHGRNKQDVTHAFHADLIELAKASDVLILTVPGGSDTERLVDAAVLNALGEDGTLINVSRGSVVDEHALIAALQHGGIAGAGLDVFTDEPHLPKELLAWENVVVLPHLGSSTVSTRQAMVDKVIGNILAFSQGTTLPDLIPELRTKAR